MRIVGLQAENFKKLVAVEIRPTGDVVSITGRNAQGKTSILDAIWAALAGAEHIQAQPIRAGEKTARIRLDLGELKVERRFTEKGGTLILENAEGARFPSPQKMLDSLIGALSFDPLAFVRMKPRAQYDELRRIAKVAVDFDKLDAANLKDYENRTEINRLAKAARARGEAIAPSVKEGTAAVDETALLNKLQDAAVHNQDVAARLATRRGMQTDAQRLRADAESLRTQAADLRAQADVLDERAARSLAAAEQKEEALANASDVPAVIDVETVRAELDAAKAINAGVAQLRDRAAHFKNAADLEAEAEGLTAAIAAREKQKADAIMAAQMPVAGLGFGADVVTFNGIPLDQASSAEQLRVSLAIAMAANPKLRVIRIQDGSLLDPDSLAHIEAMAAAGDFQVWIERVDATGKVGIVIEDGMVVAVNEDHPAAVGHGG